MLKFALLAAALVATVPAGATTAIGTLYSTGVDNAGAATTGHGADLHWSLGEASAYTGGANGVFPIGPWVAETATARWITPSANAADSYDPSVDGLYTYTETFSLAGYKAATAKFSGTFAADNTVDSIVLNGTTLAASGGSFSSLTSFTSAGGTFNAGLNTITFTVRNFALNGGNPTGLFVNIAGTAAVPEPASWALMVAGLGLVGIATRRRTRTIAA